MATKTKAKKFDALKWVSLAAAREDNRPVLTLAHWNEKTSTLACADGFRLFVARGLTPPENIVQGASDQYVPVRKLRDGSMDVSGIDGKFPDFECITPKVYRGSFTVDVEHLTQAIKLALVYAKDNNNSVRFDVYPESGVMRVSGKSNEHGDCETVVACVGLEWFDRSCHSFSAAYNGRYILDALTGWDSVAVLNFGAKSKWDQTDTALLLIGDLEDHYAIVMPMAVNRDGATMHNSPTQPTIEPLAIGYRYAETAMGKHEAQLQRAVDTLRRKHKKYLDSVYTGRQVGRSIRHMLAESPEAALRNDIYNALTLSAAAHGDPKVEYTPNMLTVHLRSCAHYWRNYSEGVQRGTQFDVNPDRALHPLIADSLTPLALTGDLVYSVAQAWHWERVIARAFTAPDIKRRYTPRYQPGTGVMSAFRKRARLLGA